MPGPVSVTSSTARAACRSQDDGDLAAGRGELQRVAEQVRDHLVQPARIGQDWRRGQLPVQAIRPRRTGGPGCRPRRRRARPGRRAGGSGCRVAASAAARSCRSPTIRASRSTSSRSEASLLGQRGLGYTVQQRLMPGLQHRDRGPQLMGHSRDEVTADLLLPVQRARPSGRRRPPARATRQARRTGPPGPAGSPASSPGSRDQPGDRPGDPRTSPGRPPARAQPPARPPRRSRVSARRAACRRTGHALAGEPGRGLPDRLAADRHRRARRRPRLRGEVGRGCDGMTRPVADLGGRADALCQVQDRRQVGGGPAVVPIPGPPAATAIALVNSVRCCLARAETSAAAKAAVSPARQRDRQERQRQPQPERITTGTAPRRAGTVTHRGPGRAGTLRPARSPRSADPQDPPRSCGAGSSRANRRSAHSLRIHTPVPG